MKRGGLEAARVVVLTANITLQIPPLRRVMFAVNTTTRAASRPPRFMVVYSFPIVNLPRREENTEELGNVFQFRKIYHFISNRRHLSELACDVSHVTAHTSVGISFHNERAIKVSGTWEYDISYK